MHERAPQLAQKRISWAASTLWLGFLLLAIVLADSRPATAIPAFARKYGMPCSACHEVWPKLSPFGQSFKDNGYQLMNDRDAPIFQQPAYWPITFRMTPIWHRESSNRVAVDGATAGSTVEAQVTTHGFDWSGLDFHTGGTLAKNFSFYLLPSSDGTGAFHFETVYARLDNLLGSSWLNIKFGKFELDNLHSEKRILTISALGGSYQNYHFQPPGEALYKFGIGDNQAGVEWMGHSKDDRTRLSASLLSASDGQPGLPTSRGYETFLAGSRAFEVGSLGLQRVGAFAYIGQAPTFFQHTVTTPPTTIGTDSTGGPVMSLPSTANVPGTGIGNKGYYRAGLIGMWYVKKLDVTTMYFHGWDSAFLGTNTPANSPLPTGAQAPTWNGGLFETHYTLNPQFILINRYELIRMSRQAFATNPDDLGNVDALTFGYRYYPFISTRAGFAFHTEYAIVRTRKTAPISGLDLTGSSLLFGFDFDY
jgi:hypothetical protein